MRLHSPTTLVCRWPIGNKTRRDHTETAHVLEVIGEVKNKNVVIVDDFTISGGTLISMAEVLTKPRSQGHLRRRVAWRFGPKRCREDRRQPDQATVHDGHDRDP